MQTKATTATEEITVRVPPVNSANKEDSTESMAKDAPTQDTITIAQKERDSMIRGSAIFQKDAKGLGHSMMRVVLRNSTIAQRVLHVLEARQAET